jgi:nucleotide-binding universal stress UspA family protein
MTTNHTGTHEPIVAPAARSAPTAELPSYKTVLACTDFSPLSAAAIGAALELGDTFGAERVHVVHVLPLLPEARDLVHEEGERAVRMLESLDLPLSRVPSVTREVRPGEPAQTLALLAGEIGADLIVVGSHGRGVVGRVILGSVAQELIRVSPSPVLVLHEGERRAHRFESVVAAVDLTPISTRIIANAVAMAKPFGGAVRALSVFEGEYPLAYGVAFGQRAPQGSIEARRRSQLLQLVNRVPHEWVELTPHAMVNEDPFHGLRDFADREQPDLIVVGTSGRSSWERLMVGSTATKVLSWARCPVLVVPYEGP